MSNFGLIGTITSDHITQDSGRTYHGLGGILYQAAVLCGLGEDVFLHANCGLEMKTDFEDLIGGWKTLRREGLRFVEGSGNQVFLRYSEKLKEREEILASVVPPLDAAAVLAGISRLDMLLMVFNSGFDVTLPDWRRIMDHAECPVWLDIHSLALAKKLRVHREYVAVPDWLDYARGAAYLQANRQEVASLLGHPDRWPDPGEIPAFAEAAFGVGVKAVFVTMGKDGVRVTTPEESRLVRAPEAGAVVDTTGCGDVFCAKAMQALAGDRPVFEAAAAGVALASRAVGLAGIRETYELGAIVSEKDVSQKRLFVL